MDVCCSPNHHMHYPIIHHFRAVQKIKDGYDTIYLIPRYESAIQQHQKNEQKPKSKKILLPETSLTTNPPSPVKPTAIVTSTASNSINDGGPRRLHVTNLPFKIKDNELKSMFEAHGSVLDAEIIYNERGSKVEKNVLSKDVNVKIQGFGFVTMESPEDAEKAKNALNGKEMEGRKIEVNNATPRSGQKTVSRLVKSRSPVHMLATPQMPGLTQAIPMQNLSPAWNPSGLNGPTTIPIPHGHQIQFAYPQHPMPTVHHTHQATFSVAPNTIHAPIPGINCFPTPDQYAQYYNYITSHHQQGPFRTACPTTTPPVTPVAHLTNYRYQPY